MQRTDVAELLDSGEGTAEEIAASLRDLRRINRQYGGISTTTALLRRVASRSGAKALTVLDVAAGNGDVIAQSAERLDRREITFRATLLDRDPGHFDLRNHLPRVGGDALALPFGDDSFDIVTCSLFLHHLAPEQVRQFAREALRVARRAFVINDLERSRLHLLFIYLGLPTFSRITRHDALASVRRAYTPAEARAMLNAAGTSSSGIEVSRHYFYRMGLIAWKRPPATI